MFRTPGGCSVRLFRWINFSWLISLRSLLRSKTSGVQIHLARIIIPQGHAHPRRPRGTAGGSQSGREKERDESFQVRAKEPLGTDSHRAISKNSSGCRLLIGHKKCFVLLCPIGEQFLLSSFRALSPVLENFLAPFLPTRLTAPGSPRMGDAQQSYYTGRLRCETIRSVQPVSSPLAEANHRSRVIFPR